MQTSQPLNIAPDGDDTQLRAVRDAAMTPRAPLTRLQSFVVASVAVAYAAPSLDPALSQTERYAELSRIATTALTLAASGADGKYLVRARLVGGIEELPNHQQLALSLRFEHGLSNDAIAAVMGVTLAELRTCFAAALEALWGGL